jgi:hypothetical protein
MMLLSLLLACGVQAPLAPVVSATETARTVAGVRIGDAYVATLSGLELRVDAAAVTRPGPQLIARARTNRDLSSVFSFVPDDAFGSATLRGARRFDVGGGAGSELASLLSGAPLLVDIETASGRPAGVTGWVTFGPRVTSTTTTPDLRVTGVRPIRLRGATAPVRYRVEITSSRAFESVGLSAPAGVALTARSTRAWTLDLDHAAWMGLSQAPAALTFDGAETLLVSGGARVVGAGLTDADPYVTVYRDCDPAVLACLDATTGVDTSACGSAFEVSRCEVADTCAVRGTTPLTLVPASTPGVEVYADAWNAAAIFGGAWGSVETPVVQVYPACPDRPVDLRTLTEAVIAGDRDFGGFDYTWGEELDRPGLEASGHFGTAWSPEGPALLAAAELFGGGGAVRAWHGESEVPCPNCHAWIDLYVLWFEERGQVVVVRAAHGWDS